MPLLTERQARMRYIRELLKSAASTKASKHTKARIGKRPIRVSTLLKKESAQSGADLRLPVMGGTKFPTGDSLSGAKKLLKEHQNNAKFGGPTQSIKSNIPNNHPSIDVMPKVGADMSNDPLIQYLRKQSADERVAGKDWPKGSRKFEKGELVDASCCATPTGNSEKANLDEDPTQENKSFPNKKAVSEWHGYMSKMFDNKAKKKGEEKDYPHKAGTVDKVARS